MIFVASALNRWLHQHGIDPSKVTVVLRCDDEMVQSQIDVCLRRELEPLLYNSKLKMPSLRFILHGLNFIITTLDSSAKV